MEGGKSEKKYVSIHFREKKISATEKIAAH